MSGSIPHPLSGPRWRLPLRCLPGRGPLRGLAVWSAVEALPALLGGLLVARALDRGFLRHDLLTGLTWLAVLGGTALVRAFAVHRLYPAIAATVEPLRDALVRAVVSGSLRRATVERRPDLAGIAQLGAQVEMVRALVSTFLRTLRQVVTAVIATAVGVALLAPALAAVVVPPVLLAGVLSAALMGALGRRQHALLLADEAVATAAGPALSGVREVVACGALPQVRSTVGIAVADQARATRRSARLAALRGVVLAVGVHVPTVAVLAVAPTLVRQGTVTPGQVVGALTYLTTTLLPAVRSLVGTLGSWWVQLGIVLSRLHQAALAPDPAPVPAATAAGGRPAGRADLRAEEIWFAYGPDSEPVLDDVTLELPEGDHLAVVGASGIGKSTLADLLSGVLAPDRGRLLLGGAPVAEIAPHLLRRRIALLPQEAYVFTGTVRENLTYLCPDADDRALDAAVAAVGLAAVIARLGGYDAELTSPRSVLSSGERQLVALARVYLSPADVVVLDEASCHLDAAAEARVEAAFAARGGTLVVVAHRLSSARRARRILVMDGNRPVIGTHLELLAASPAYATLVGAL